MTGVVSAIVGSIIGVIPFWLLWNWLMPIIFNLPKIDIFQAFGLLIMGYLFSAC